ncbi:TetR/AcrR family transcriptional regulator [Risungbinella massiliensis]|uniref:TetR/AcrR family transcriptional regulator n=1 Tax=Risungbinella massiliensis TaxID=1329796 RepID=UPI0011CC55C3|nr:TetR/AcrR family transcriptional regulator [Risungbinella massiliensis]
MGKKYRTNVGKRSPGRPKRSEQKKLDTESQILHHAGLLFMKSGYAAVSISNITKEVGITKPTLYHYFPDKEHLYTAVLCTHLERVSKEILKGLEGSQSIRSKLFELAYVFFRCAPISMSTLMRDVEEHLEASLIQQVQETYERYIVIPYMNMLQIAMETGEIQNQADRLRTLVDIWLGMLDALSCQITIFQDNQEPKLLETAQTVVNVFMDGVGCNKQED